MTTTQLDVPLTPAIVTRFRSDTRYVLTGFPAGLTSLVVCLGGVSLGLGLAILWVGVPLLLATLMLARGFADAERSRVAQVLGVALRHPAGRTPTLADPQLWRDLTHAILRWIPSTVGFTAVVTWWAGVAGGLTWALWGWAIPGPGLPSLLGFGAAYSTGVVFYLVVAGLFAVTLPAVVRAAAVLEARFARWLLF